MRNYLYLLQIFGGGNLLIHKAIEKYGSAENAVNAILSRDLSTVPYSYMSEYKNASLEKSDAIIKYCQDNNIDIVTIDDIDYPNMLRNIFNPPVLLFADGDITCLNKYLTVSIVGPRIHDDYAKELAEHICSGLSMAGCVLISGFAKGIDRLVHTSGFDFNLPTAAVLACGITVDYPARSFPLRKQIKKHGGVVVSELLPDKNCYPEYFQIRNRLISGLSPAVCIVGAKNHSGTLITAAHAYQQNRELFFTIPPDTTNPAYSTVIKYLRDGAHPIYDVYDIIRELQTNYSAVMRPVPDDIYGLNNRADLASFPKPIDYTRNIPASVSNYGVNDTPYSTRKAKEYMKCQEINNKAAKAKSDIDEPYKLETDFRIPEVNYAKTVNIQESPFSEKPEETPPKPKECSSFPDSDNTIVAPDMINTMPKREFVKAKFDKSPFPEPLAPDHYLKELEIDPKERGYSELQTNLIRYLYDLGTMTMDDFISITLMDLGELSMALTEMEIKGDVHVTPGGRYTLVKMKKKRKKRKKRGENPDNEDNEEDFDEEN